MVPPPRSAHHRAAAAAAAAAATGAASGAAAAGASGTAAGTASGGGNANATTATPVHTDRDMIEIGLDIDVSVMDKKKLVEKRIKKGQCPSCGTQIYKVSGFFGGKKKQPLTVQGLVHHGRCLQCQPIRTNPTTNKKSTVKKKAPPPAPAPPPAVAAAAAAAATGERERGEEEGKVAAKPRAAAAQAKGKGEGDEEEVEYFDDDYEDTEDFHKAGVPRFLRASTDNMSIGDMSAITLDHRLRSSSEYGGVFERQSTLDEEEEYDNDDYEQQQQQADGDKKKSHDLGDSNVDHVKEEQDEEEEIMLRRIQAAAEKAAAERGEKEGSGMGTGGGGGRGRGTRTTSPRPEPSRGDLGGQRLDPPHRAEQKKIPQQQQQREQQQQQREQQQQRMEPPQRQQSIRSVNFADTDDEEVNSAVMQMLMHNTSNTSSSSPPISPGGAAMMVARTAATGESATNSNSSSQHRRSTRSQKSEESKHEISSPKPGAVYNPPWAATGAQQQPNKMKLSPNPRGGSRGSGSGGGVGGVRTNSAEEIFFDSSQLCDLETAEQQPDIPSDVQDNPHQSQNHRTEIEQEIHLLPEFLPVDNDPYEQNQQQQQQQHDSFNNSLPRIQQQEHTERDIPSLVNALTTNTRGDRSSCIEALQLMTLIIWKSSPTSSSQRGAKHIFADCQGISKLNETMWSDFMNVALQQAAFDLFLALAAFPEQVSTTASATTRGRAAAASAANTHNQDVLVGEAAQNIIDTLLLVMQELLHQESIQQTGCRILLCLAKASADNPLVHDGSMSGSVEVVLQAMQYHGGGSGSSDGSGGGGRGGARSVVPAVQEWGIRTLYQMCVASRHAESNKRTLLRWNNISSGGGSGDNDNSEGSNSDTGGEVTTRILLRAMEYGTQDAVKLYWRLTSSEDVADMLSPNAARDTMAALLRFVHRAYQKEHAIMTSTQSSTGDVVDYADFVIDLATEHEDLLIILEAALATISNLIRIPKNGTALNPTQVCKYTLDILEFHLNAIDELLSNRDSVDDATMLYCNNYISLCTEACGLIANLASLATIVKGELVQVGGVHRLVKALTVSTPSDNGRPSAVVEAVHEESIRALLCLVVDSEPVMMAIVRNGGELFEVILQACRYYERDAAWQEVMCRILTSLFSRENAPPIKAAIKDDSSNSLEGDGLLAICAAMKFHADSERVQETACLAVRNLASREENVKLLLKSEAVSFAVAAMERYGQSRTIQTHVSCILWSLGTRASEACSGSSGEKGSDVANNAIQCIIKAIQNHLEDGELLEMACGALLGLIFNSDSRKQQVDKGGIEAINTCGLVMHQDDLKILEISCELLASLSTVKSLVPFIVEAQGVVNVVDAMRNHTSSTNLLRSGALCLKNIIVAQPEISDDAGGAVTATINAMRSHVDDSAFQREACNFLWAVSALSEDAKSKILALDGLAVLMNTIENDSPDVQKAALGAVNELMVLNTSSTPTAGTETMSSFDDEGKHDGEVRA